MHTENKNEVNYVLSFILTWCKQNEEKKNLKQIYTKYTLFFPSASVLRNILLQKKFFYRQFLKYCVAKPQ